MGFYYLTFQVFFCFFPEYTPFNQKIKLVSFKVHEYSSQ
jgi:hypothetical protein